MQELPGPETEPVSPALVDKFLTTRPPGKSEHFIFVLQVEFSAWWDTSEFPSFLEFSEPPLAWHRTRYKNKTLC